MRAATKTDLGALDRLIQIALRDTGQSRIVANFLLAWWNADQCGGFDLTDVWGVDRSIAVDMLHVFALLAGCHEYPDTMGFARDMEAIVRVWRPTLIERC